MGYKTYNPNASRRCILEMVTMCDKESRTDILTYKRLLEHTVDIGNMLISGINVRIPVAIRGDNTLTNDKYIPNLMTAVTFSNTPKIFMQSLGFSPWIEVSMNEMYSNVSQMRELCLRRNRCPCFMVKPFYASDIH